MKKSEVKYSLQRIDSLNWGIVKTSRPVNPKTKKHAKIPVEKRLSYYPTLLQAALALFELEMKEVGESQIDFPLLLEQVKNAERKVMKAIMKVEGSARGKGKSKKR